MKPFIAILLAACIFTSCASTNRIIEINNSKKEIKGFRLIQNLKAHAAEKSSNTLINQYYNIKTACLFEEQTDQKPVVTLEFHFATSVQAVKLDSVMYLKLDNEAVRIVSNVITQEISENTSAANKNSLILAQFTIPENLWLSVANSRSIVYKLSCVNIGIEIKPDSLETAIVKEFFNKAMQRRLEIIPLVPSGSAKW